MGKKLRNREVLTDTEHTSQPNQNDSQPFKAISLASIRKNIKTRLQKSAFDSFQRRSKNLRKQIENKQLAHHIDPSLFSCSICLELMVSPTMLICGHTFCYRCLDSNRAQSKRCSLCREEDESGVAVPSRIIQKFVQEVIVPSTPVGDMMSHLCKITDSREWIKKRRVGNVKIGQLVDFRTCFGKWITGVVKNFISLSEVVIKYRIENYELTETLPIRSQRIARFTFFTKRRYLQDFPSDFFSQIQENIQNIQTNEFPMLLSSNEDFNLYERNSEGNHQLDGVRQETHGMFDFRRDDDLEMLNFF